jgi:hypothetical protein
MSTIIGCCVIAFWISQILSMTFSCQPVQYLWDKTIPNGYCVNVTALALGITGASFVTDLMVWGLPIPSVWGLQLKLSRKLTVTGLFLLGGL